MKVKCDFRLIYIYIYIEKYLTGNWGARSRYIP